MDSGIRVKKFSLNRIKDDTLKPYNDVTTKYVQRTTNTTEKHIHLSTHHIVMLCQETFFLVKISRSVKKVIMTTMISTVCQIRGIL